MHYVAIAILTALITGLLSWFFRKSKPAALTDSDGLIKPDKISAFITVFIGGLMAAGGLVGAIFILRDGTSPDALWAFALFVMGTCIAVFMAPALTDLHDVSWDAFGLTGPANTFGPTLGRRRTTIAWSDIVKRGETITQYWFVESGDRRRIYWSYLYRGHGALDQVIAERCPNLDQSI